MTTPGAVPPARVSHTLSRAVSFSRWSVVGLSLGDHVQECYFPRVWRVSWGLSVWISRLSSGIRNAVRKPHNFGLQACVAVRQGGSGSALACVLQALRRSPTPRLLWKCLPRQPVPCGVTPCGWSAVDAGRQPHMRGAVSPRLPFCCGAFAWSLPGLCGSAAHASSPSRGVAIRGWAALCTTPLSDISAASPACSCRTAVRSPLCTVTLVTRGAS